MELQASQVKEAALRQRLNIPAAWTTHPSHPSQFRARGPEAVPKLLTQDDD